MRKSILILITFYDIAPFMMIGEEGPHEWARGANGDRTRHHCPAPGPAAPGWPQSLCESGAQAGCCC